MKLVMKASLSALASKQAARRAIGLKQVIERLAIVALKQSTLQISLIEKPVMALKYAYLEQAIR
jgi:hypothetical protein